MSRFSLFRGLVSVLLVGLLFAPATVAQIEREVSEVTGVERIESADMRDLRIEQYEGSHASFRAAYVNDPDEGIAWELSFYGFTESPTPVSETNTFRVQADGQSFEPTQLTSKTRQIDSTTLEIKRASFSRSTFETIATADQVTFSIGAAQFTAPRLDRGDMRRILKELPSDPTPRTASTDSSGDR
jgi:hypothetical protein